MFILNKSPMNTYLKISLIHNMINMYMYLYVWMSWCPFFSCFVFLVLFGVYLQCRYTPNIMTKICSLIIQMDSPLEQV